MASIDNAVHRQRHEFARFLPSRKVSSSAFYRWRTLLGEGPTVQATHSAAAFVDLGALGAPQKSSARLELSIDLGGGIVLTLVRN